MSCSSYLASIDGNSFRTVRKVFVIGLSTSSEIWMVFCRIMSKDVHNSQWTHLCRFTINSTSKFHVQSSSKLHRFWKTNPRWNYDINSTWIRLSKSTKYRWILHVNFSMSFPCRIDVTSVLAFSMVSFSNIFCSGNLF